MREILEEYKEQVKYFILNKKYMITIVIVAILSYGFAITHYAIGVDDLCFDRYIHGTYILSAGRWGIWLLYNVLQINEFSPFWLDTLVSMLMVVITIVLCAFIRKQYGDKIKIWAYIIFSCLLISNPMINLFFMYQSTNLAIVISNLMVIICAITIFENYFHENKKLINIICGLLLTIPISMYESCAQTYLVLLFITIFIKITQNKEKNKRLFGYFCFSIAMLALGIVLYFIIGKILLVVLEKTSMLNKNFACMKSLWLDKNFWHLSSYGRITTIQKILQFEWNKMKNYFPIVSFILASFATIFIAIVQLVKDSKVSKMLCVLGAICSNLILILVQLVVICRAQFSGIVTFAFMGLYIYQVLGNKKIVKYFINIVAVLLIIIQSRMLNQYFYNDYKRYEKEKNIANDIGISVTKSCDYENKPLYYILSSHKGKNYNMNYDNSTSVLAWGIGAFEECQTEVTKFINEQGYHFKYMTKEEGNKAKKQYSQLDDETKKRQIIELENVIIVNLNVYDF